MFFQQLTLTITLTPTCYNDGRMFTTTPGSGVAQDEVSKLFLALRAIRPQARGITDYSTYGGYLMRMHPGCVVGSFRCLDVYRY